MEGCCEAARKSGRKMGRQAQTMPMLHSMLIQMAASTMVPTERKVSMSQERGVDVCVCVCVCGRAEWNDSHVISASFSFRSSGSLMIAAKQTLWRGS